METSFAKPVSWGASILAAKSGPVTRFGSSCRLSLTIRWSGSESAQSEPQSGGLVTRKMELYLEPMEHEDDLYHHHDHGSEFSEMQLRVRALESIFLRKG